MNEGAAEAETSSSFTDLALLYLDRRVLRMFFLGFSAGLPLLLVYGTLSVWLREEGLSLQTIGYIAGVSFAYGFKYLWAPFVDRLALPGLTRTLGQRRGWMLLAQICVALGLLGMASTDPSDEVVLLTVFALAVAFASATQDIAIDAYRIESAPDDFQAAMSATYVLGYRIGMLLAGAWAALRIADIASFPVAYGVMASLMIVGMTTVLVSPEPPRGPRNVAASELEARAIAYIRARGWGAGSVPRLIAWFYGAAVCPLIEFFARRGWKLALFVLLLVLCYRLSDLTLGVLANVFYRDIGFSKTEIADITKAFGFPMLLVGAFLGGVLARKLGVLRCLLLGAIMVAATNLLFVWLTVTGPDGQVLMAVISADNISAGVATTAFIAYLSSLTNRAYTATQYALLSSVMLLLGVALKTQSGTIAELLGYQGFFFYCAALGIPGILLVGWLLWRGDTLSGPTKSHPADTVVMS